MNNYLKIKLIVGYIWIKFLTKVLYCSMDINALNNETLMPNNSTVRYKLELNKFNMKKSNGTLNISKHKTHSSENSSTSNVLNRITNQIWYQETLNKLMKNGTLNRGMYILIGMTSILLIYFLIKAISIKKRRRKVKKYGILNGGDFDYDAEDGGGIGDWGDSWSRKPKLLLKDRNKSKNGAAHKWEMTPLDHFDPNADSQDDDDGSDLDLYRAPLPRSAVKKSLPKASANQLYYKSTLTSEPPTKVTK